MLTMRRTVVLAVRMWTGLPAPSSTGPMAMLPPAGRLPASTHSRKVLLLRGCVQPAMMPNIDAANISYNLLKTAAGGNIAIGPVLLGAAKPVHILTASTTVRRIVNMTALTVADANAARGAPGA